MGQGDSAEDFDPSESMENAGILDVFPIFHTARSGQKIRRSPQLPLCGAALGKLFPISPGRPNIKTVPNRMEMSCSELLFWSAHGQKCPAKACHTNS